MPAAPSSRLTSPDRRPWLRRAVSVVALVLAAAVAAPSLAQSTDTLHKDLATGADFRVRVTAALALGKAKQRVSVGPLSNALRDGHPAVRAAAAAALGSLGDAAAVTALEQARGSEQQASVRRELENALAKIRAQNPQAKLLVQMGKLENKSGNPRLGPTFQKVAKDEIARLPGVEILAERTDPAAEAKRRRLPTLALDGQLVQVQKATTSSEVGFHARVEFVIRKIPEQSLKGAVRGNAKALSNARAVRGEKELAVLQEDAVVAAVQSAIRGAPPALEAATR